MSDETIPPGLREGDPIPASWNQVEAPYPATLCLPDLLERQVQQRPEVTAVSAAGQSWSYAQLWSYAQSVGEALQQQGVEPGSYVGIATERSCAMVGALYGVFLAGAAYVPIDPYYPPVRMGFMLEDAEIRCLLTEEHLSPQLPTSDIPQLFLEGLPPQPRQEFRAAALTPDAVAYAMYTSGSTGRPKCATIHHGGIVNLLEAMKHKPGLDHSDTLVEVISLSHDMSVSDIFLSLSVGARLVVAGRQDATNAPALAALLQQVKATFLSATPTTFRMLLEEGWQPAVPITLLSAGEPLPKQLVGPLLARGCQLWNGYGMTEASVYSTLTPITDPDGPITIGGRILNTPIYILDPDGAPTAIGQPGELYSAGVGVGYGYLKRPEMTARRFLDDPFFPQYGGRMYRSGDLARWLPNGDIECLGRMDHQVKIRGFRVELDEIEALLQSHEEVRAAVARAWEIDEGDTRLVAYIVSDSQAHERLFSQLRDLCVGRLPEYMVPSRFAALEAIPLTPAGKIDRLALPAPDASRPREAGPLHAPNNATQAALCALFAKHLKLRQVGLHDDFFALGGHSLLAARLCADIREALELELDPSQIFLSPTPAALAARSFAPALSPPAPRKDEGLGVPLSYPQLRLWFIHQLDPDTTAYNVSTVLRLQGELEPEALQRALDGLFARHQTLRLRLVQGAEGPLQVVDPPGPVECPRWPLEDQEAEEAKAIRDRFFQRPFDLERGPLCRCALLQRSADLHELLFSMHHAICDGWSLHLLFRDWAALYKAALTGEEAELPELEVHYLDFAAWQRESFSPQRLERSLAYWTQQLRGAPAQLALPELFRGRPDARSTVGGGCELQLPAAQVQRLEALGQSQGATLFMTLLSAFAALWWSETGQGDLPFGTAVADRPHQALEPLLGFFANTIVLRVQARPQLSFLQLLAHVREIAVGGYGHQELPFERLVQALCPERNSQHQPLFQVSFILNPHFRSLALPGLTCQVQEVDSGSSPVDLMVQMWLEDGALRGSFIYREDVLPRPVVARLVERYEGILEACLAHPRAPLQELAPPRMSAEAESQLLAHPEIVDGVVTLRSTPDGRLHRVGAYVQKAPRSRTPALSSELLDHAVEVAAIPLTQTGDLDLEALAALPHLDPSASLPPGVVQVHHDTWDPRPQWLHVHDLLPGLDPWTQEPTTPGRRERAVVPGEGLEAYQRGAPLEFPPDAPKSLPQMLVEAARRCPQHGLVTLDERGEEARFSYPGLLERASRIAQGLADAGRVPGDIVLMQLDDTDAFLQGLWGCWIGGFVAAPVAVPMAFEGGGLEKLLNGWLLLQKPALLTQSRLQEPLARVAQERGLDWQLLVLEELLHCPPAAPHLPDSDDALALLLLTSGSTGAPKAVRHHHRTLAAYCEAHRQSLEIQASEVFLNWLPIHHAGGLLLCHLPATYNGAQQIHPHPQAFARQPTRWLDWMERYQASFTWAPNFAYALLNEEAHALETGSWDLSKVRIIVNGAETIVSATLRRCLGLLQRHGLPKDAMVPAWGMSETVTGITFLRSFTLDESRDDQPFVSVGSLSPGSEMRIVSEAGEPLAYGQIGQLQVRGPTLTSGYQHLPQQTAASFAPGGWFRTGDLGYLDERGLTLTGRSKDLIIIRGVSHHGHEIEAAVDALPGVRPTWSAACAVRSPFHDTDQLAIFFAPVGQPSDAELRGLLQEIRKAVVQQAEVSPAFILPLETQAIPKTDIGKLQRSRLKARFEEGAFRELLKQTDALLENERCIPRWFYRQGWFPRRLRPTLAPLQGGRVWFFCEAVHEALARSFAQVGMEVLQLTRGFEQAQGLASLERDAPPTLVLYGWHDEDGSGLLPLAQHLEGQKNPAPLALLYGDSRAPNAGALGLARTLAQEAPLARVIGLQWRGEVAPCQQRDDILLELRQPANANREVLFDRGQRKIPQLEALSLPGALPMPWEPGSLVLVSGGLGGLARWLAEDLLRRWECRLLLLGRTPLEGLCAEAKARWEHLRKAAGQKPRAAVEYAAVDVADPRQLEAAVEAFEGRWQGTLGGIFHLAGVQRDVVLRKESAAGLDSVSRPRLWGAKHLGALLLERGSGCFVDVGLANALWGGVGAGAYAAALRGGQAHAKSLNDRGIRAYHIACSRWDEVGMSRALPGGSHSQSKGFTLLSPHRGRLSFWACLQLEPGAYILGPDAANPAIRRHLRGAPIACTAPVFHVEEGDDSGTLELRDRYGAAFEAPTRQAPRSQTRQAAPEPAPAPASKALQEAPWLGRLTSLWKELLQIEQLSLDDSFFDIGGHSLLLAQVQRGLEDRWGRFVPFVELFRYPTLRSLASYLGQPSAEASADEADPARSQARRRAAQQRERLQRTRKQKRPK